MDTPELCITLSEMMLKPLIGPWYLFAKQFKTANGASVVVVVSVVSTDVVAPSVCVVSIAGGASVVVVVSVVSTDVVAPLVCVVSIAGGASVVVVVSVVSIGVVAPYAAPSVCVAAVVAMMASH